MLALFFASTISLCADGQIGPRARAFLTSRVLVSCGKVSYGMYIFHWPVLILAIPTLKRLQVGLSEAGQLGVNSAFMLGAIVLVWGASQLSFTYFESPFLKLKNRFLG